MSIAAIGATVAIAATVATGHAPAHTAHPTPTQRTCADFRAWHAHKTTANLDAMLTASERAPWSNLGNDVNVVYADVRGHNTYDLAGDIAGIIADCKGK